MSSLRAPIPRKLAGSPQAGSEHVPQAAHQDAARMVRHTLIDFSSLALPSDVQAALSQAFWGHIGGHADRSIVAYWKSLLPFANFAAESQSVGSVADLNRAMLLRYVEWLNAQRCADGRAWALTTRAAVYGTLRQLLRWLERCRPELIAGIDYPFSPFPGKAAARTTRSTLSERQLRAILRACEEEITQMRADRESAARQRASDSDQAGSLGWVLEQLDQRHGGVIPDHHTIEASGNFWLQKAVRHYGGAKRLAPFLYPRAVSLLPYYLAILIHTAGNPEAIAALTRDCLQPLPLLDDRELLVWFKARASCIQRRTFDRADALGPPALVREILAWNERLVPLAPPAQRNRLFIFKGQFTVNAMSIITVHHQLGAFCDRHSLPRFAPASIRPSVLGCFYRASGDLMRTKAVANHANVATTVRYVQTPLVEAQNRSRIADLQGAFIEHIEGRSGPSQPRCGAVPEPSPPPLGRVVTLFGFDCTDPFAGIAPGTRRGDLCTKFMGCFTCPNAVIPADPKSLARLLQARDHLRAAAAHLHPARWEGFYAPQLRILEEDILPRFGSREIDAGRRMQAELPPLPDLR